MSDDATLTADREENTTDFGFTRLRGMPRPAWSRRF